MSPLISTCDIDQDIQAQWIRAGAYQQEIPVSTEYVSGLDFPLVLVGGKLINKDSIPARYQTKLGAFDSHIRQMIDMVTVPDHWVADGIRLPNQRCKDESFRIAAEVFSAHGLIPISAHSSIEEGIMLLYWDNASRRSLKIEIYNDGAKAGLVNQNKDILASADINSMFDIETLVKDFEG
ncbi:MAG: hypothetical protein GY731_05835 [Gammaproteobacteria bacterium]|nr:hypothetical protein [Gammaproteobacteria bacterium]